MFRKLDGPGRDGSLDNMIVAHEWGHYFHHRLTDCTTVQCGAMSEGWGDFLAVHTALREGDNLDGTFAAGIYGPRSLGDSAYFGIRRFPYSVDFTKNGLTFKHIQNGVPLPSTPINNRRHPQRGGAQRRRGLVLDAVRGLRGPAQERGRALVRRRPARLFRLPGDGPAAGPARRHLHRDPGRDPDRGLPAGPRRRFRHRRRLRPPGRRQLRRLASPRRPGRPAGR